MEQQGWIKSVFEWVGKFAFCITVALITRLVAEYFGAKETSAAMWSGMVLSICMFETGILKAGFRK